MHCKVALRAHEMYAAGPVVCSKNKQYAYNTTNRIVAHKLISTQRQLYFSTISNCSDYYILPLPVFLLVKIPVKRFFFTANIIYRYYIASYGAWLSVWSEVQMICVSCS